MIRASLIVLLCLILVQGCTSYPRYYKEPSTEQLQQMNRRQFLEAMGEPSFIDRDRTVFDYGPGGWLKGCDGFGYHVLSKDGQVGEQIFYFQGNRWVGLHGSSLGSEPHRILRSENKCDLDLIEGSQRTKNSSFGKVPWNQSRVGDGNRLQSSQLPRNH